jgi:hypothetical protein
LTVTALALAVHNRPAQQACRVGDRLVSAESAAMSGNARQPQ